MGRFRSFDQFLDLIPDPLSSLEQYYRFHHLDIPQLEDNELADEFNYLRTRLWQLPAHHWVRQRVAMIESELKRRQITNYKPKRRGKLKPTGVIPL